MSNVLYEAALDVLLELGIKSKSGISDEIFDSVVAVVKEFADESVGTTRAKGGFTGRREDKLGRSVCYSQGHRVSCNTPKAPTTSEHYPAELGEVTEQLSRVLTSGKIGFTGKQAIRQALQGVSDQEAVSAYRALDLPSKPTNKREVEQALSEHLLDIAYGKLSFGGSKEESVDTHKLSPTHQKVISKTREALSQASHLDADKRKAYEDAFASVLGKMPEKAVSLMEEGLKQTKFHSDVNSVTEAWKGTGNAIPEGKAIGGFYSHKEGIVNLDGVIGLEALPGSKEPSRNIKGAYAHELTHAIDRGHRLSSSPVWKEAYKSEIKGEPHRLTRYAASSEVEAFAEFGRLLWGSDVDRELVSKTFPKCLAYFQGQGLL